jgi:hypothetical protein
MQTQLLVAKAYYQESHQINLKIYGHTHPENINAASKVTAVTSKTIKNFPGLI